MLPPTQDLTLAIAGPLGQYSINIKVIDFLSNEETVNDKLALSNTKVTQRTVLATEQQSIRLEIGLATQEATEPIKSRSVPHLNVPPISN